MRNHCICLTGNPLEILVMHCSLYFSAIFPYSPQQLCSQAVRGGATVIYTLELPQAQESLGLQSPRQSPLVWHLS